MARGLDGKVALVTGAASGIGRASALEFARQGARLVVADVDEDGVQETAKLVQREGPEALAVRCDVAQSAQVSSMVRAAVDRFGRLDCAFNNAGIEGQVVPTEDYDEAMFDRVIAVNLRGVFLCLRHELPVMVKQGGGAIVNTASAAGLVALGGFSAYVASKHGVVGLTKTAALEYGTKGVRVNAVCPGAVQTPMVARLASQLSVPAESLGLARPVHALGRASDSIEIARAAVWLCSDEASFVTGIAMPVDGGWTAH